MASKTYSFAIEGVFSSDSYLIATSTILDALKGLPSMQLQRINFVEWNQETAETVEVNNVTTEESTVLEQEASIMAAEAASLE